MELVSQRAGHRGGSHAVRKVLAASAVLLGVCATGGVQAATLTCGAGATPVRITTSSSAGWSTDARNVNAAGGDIGAASIVDDYRYGSWFDPAAASPVLNAKWLSFGDVGAGYPRVNVNGVRANGARVAGRATFIYNENVTVASNVDLSTIKVTGRGGSDDNVNFQVMPLKLPGNVDNVTSPANPTWPWVAEKTLTGAAWGTLDNNIAITNVPGFYYGDNSIGLSIFSQQYNDTFPGGVVADLEITADCLTPVAAQPTEPLMCPAGNKAGDTVRLGPFTTNARDWKWTWRTNAAGTALENVEQTLFDDFIWRGYFKPAALTGGAATAARWISPGTTDPAGADIPGVPYPLAIGQHKAGFYGTVFTLNQPILVANNVDLSSIKLDGRFGFDNTGDSVFVQPAGQAAPTSFTHLLPDGYGAFTTYTTPVVPGFARGSNTIGLVLDGGEPRNDCAGGGCAMAAIADFYVTAVCTGAAPIDPRVPVAVPALDVVGLGLLSLLGAGAGALALRRRKSGQ